MVKALLLNCTLRKLHTISNAGAFIDKAIDILQDFGIENEIIRVMDYSAASGIFSDEDEGDKRHSILKNNKSLQHFYYADSYSELVYSLLRRKWHLRGWV